VAFEFARFDALTAFTSIGVLFLPIGCIVTGGVVATLISIEESIRIQNIRAAKHNEI